MAAGTFIILVASELCLLLRLLIPKLIEFGEARYDAVYGHAHGDRPFIPTIRNNFHTPFVVEEAQRHHVPR